MHYYLTLSVLKRINSLHYYEHYKSLHAKITFSMISAGDS